MDNFYGAPYGTPYGNFLWRNPMVIITMEFSSREEGISA
jgi:hypothetical protein